MAIAEVAYKPHIYQARFHNASARQRVVVAGRQSGKTLGVVQEEAVWAMSAPKRWPEEKFPQFWWTTAFDKTRGKAWRDFGHFVPREIIKRSHESEAWFEFRNGARISMRSAEGMTSMVSERLHGLVCDEFCQYRPQVYDDYLAPMLATTNGPVVFLGSPWGLNWGYRTYMKGVEGLAGWWSIRWRSADSPYVDKIWLAERKLDTPDRVYRQQYDAEFLTEGGEIFRNVDAAIAPASPSDNYTVIGFDVARTRDWSHLYAFNSRGEWVDSKRVGHLDWSVQRMSVIEMYKRLKAQMVLIDVTGMGPQKVAAEIVARDLSQDGVRVVAVDLYAEMKAAVIQHLMLKFDLGQIRISMDTAEQFRHYTSVELPSGNERFSAPEGEHDDEVMAAALAVWGLRGRITRPSPPSETELQRMRREVYRDAMNDDADAWGT